MTRSRFRDLAAAAAATAAIGVLILGVPITLVLAVGWPLDSWRLAVDGVRYGQVTDDLLLAALTATVWIAWAQLAAAVAVEAVAVARGRVPGRVRLLGVMQPLAARLITTALLVSTAIGVRAAPTTPVGPPPIAAAITVEPAAFTAVDSPVRSGDPGDTTVDRRRGDESRPVYQVKRHDTLWGIAERRLGDGRRWREIHALNLGRPQPDGRALAEDDDAIDIGWRLLMPTDDPGDDPPSADAVTVTPGDTLTGLADEHIGDADAWPQLYAANVGRPQPDGRLLADPDMLLPGWRLNIPTDTPTHPDRRPGSGQQASEAAPSAVARIDPADRPPLHARTPNDPAADADDRDQTSQRAVGPSAPSEHARTAEDAAAASNGHRPAAATPPTAGHSDQSDADAGEWWWILAGAGMLAAGVAATLTRLRSAWLRRRQVGDRRSPPPDPSTAATTVLAAEATPLTRDRAILAVRAYAAGIAALDLPAPTVAGATIDPAGAIALLLYDDAPDRLPDGWVHDPRDTRQAVLPATIDTAALAHATSAGSSATAAALVSVGVGVRSRRRVLLNLDTCSALALTGPPHLIIDTMLAWAIELATSGHADALDVWLVGFDLDAPAAGWERLHVAATVTDAIHGIRTAALGDTPPADLPSRGDPDWLPQIVLCAPTVTSATIQTLTRFARPHQHAGIVTVTGDTQAADAPWRIDLDADQTTITSLQQPIALRPARRTSRDEFVAITGLVATAAGDAAATLKPPPAATHATTSPAGLLKRIAVPPTATDVQHALDADPADVVIARLFSPVRVTTPDGGQLPAGRVTEAVAYLACHRTGVSAEQLIDVLWHGAAATTQRLSEVISRARTALGGTGRLPRRDTAVGYRLAATVVTDIDVIAHHVRHAQQHPDRLVEELEAAAALIGGRPFGDVDWMWATFAGLATDAAALACDITSALGQWHLDHRDPEAALRVARIGLRAAPESEHLARLRMRAYHQRGDTDQLRAVMDDLRAAADQPGSDGDDQLHPETVRLYRTLTNT